MKIEEIEALMAMAGFAEDPSDNTTYPYDSEVIKAWRHAQGPVWLVTRRRDSVPTGGMLVRGKSTFVFTFTTRHSTPLMERIQSKVRWFGSIDGAYNDLLKVLLEVGA